MAPYAHKVVFVYQKSMRLFTKLAISLWDYTHHIPSKVGFYACIDELLMLVLEAKDDELEEYEKCVVLLVDEMHIKDDLIYEYTGKLIVFVN